MGFVLVVVVGPEVVGFVAVEDLEVAGTARVVLLLGCGLGGLLLRAVVVVSKAPFVVVLELPLGLVAEEAPLGPVSVARSVA